MGLEETLSYFKWRTAVVDQLTLLWQGAEPPASPFPSGISTLRQNLSFITGLKALVGFHGAQLSRSPRGREKTYMASQCYTSSIGLFSPSSAGLWWGKSNFAFSHCWARGEVLGSTGNLVCWDGAAERWESSHGLEHTLQDGERQLLLRKTEIFLCSFSFMWWLEEKNTWWMFFFVSARNAGLQPRTWSALFPLILPQCDSASWMSCFCN